MRLIAIDVSGGCIGHYQTVIDSFLEIGDHVAMFDSSIHGECVINSLDDIKNLKRFGGGGTMFLPVLEWAVRESQGKNVECIVFTDGYFCDGFGDIDKHPNISWRYIRVGDSPAKLPPVFKTNDIDDLKFKLYGRS